VYYTVTATTDPLPQNCTACTNNYHLEKYYNKENRRSNRAKCPETNEQCEHTLAVHKHNHTHARAFAKVKHKDPYSTRKRTTVVNYLFTA